MIQNSIQLLYIDDESINLLLFEANFEKHFKITTAISAERGLEILAENPQIKVIISDMKMPGMDGLEFVRRAKKLYPNKLFYLLSGYDLTPDTSQAIDEGIILNYFMKPFNIEEILGSISEALQN